MYIRLFQIAFLAGVSGCSATTGSSSTESSLGEWGREPLTRQPTDCTTTVTKTGSPKPGTLEIQWKDGSARQVCVAKSDPRNTQSSQMKKYIYNAKDVIDGLKDLTESAKNFP